MLLTVQRVDEDRVRYSYIDTVPKGFTDSTEACYIVVTENSVYRGISIYVRRVKSRGHGPYFQLVRSYREGLKVKQKVLAHLGRHEKPEDALAAWPSEIRHLRAIGRDDQADRLDENLKKLRSVLTEAAKRKE